MATNKSNLFPRLVLSLTRRKLPSAAQRISHFMAMYYENIGYRSQWTDLFDDVLLEQAVPGLRACDFICALDLRSLCTSVCVHALHTEERATDIFRWPFANGTSECSLLIRRLERGFHGEFGRQADAKFQQDFLICTAYTPRWPAQTRYCVSLKAQDNTPLLIGVDRL